LRATIARIIFIGFLVVSQAFGSKASDDAMRALVYEWNDASAMYPEWDPQTKRAANPARNTEGFRHCLIALELATRAQPDKEGAFQELLNGLDTANATHANAYSLPPELQGKLWDWLASAAEKTRFQTNAEHGAAFDAAMREIGEFYSRNKAGLMVIHSDIQKKDDPRAIYDLLQLEFELNGANVRLMEQFRHCYATDKQKLFNYVEAKFK
jgi:hypothetical protein